MITKVNIVFTYRSDSHKGKDLHRKGGFIHARSGFKRNRTYKGRTSGTIPWCDHGVADATPPLLGTNERTSLLVKE